MQVVGTSQKPSLLQQIKEESEALSQRLKELADRPPSEADLRSYYHSTAHFIRREEQVSRWFQVLAVPVVEPV